MPTPDTDTTLRVISGADRFRSTRAVQAALADRLDAGIEDMGLTRISGASAKPEQLATALGGGSLFAGPQRTVLIEDAEALGKGERKILLQEIEGAEEAGEDLLVLLHYGRGRKPPKAVQDAASTHDRLDSFRRREARSWLESYAQEAHGVRLERRATEAILDRVGHAHGGPMAQELNKLLVMTGGRAPTPSDVAAATGQQGNASPYDFYDRVGERDYAGARRLLPLLLSDPEYSGVRVTVGLTLHLSHLSLARTRLDEGQGGGEVAASFSRRWLGKKFVRQARGWSLSQLDDALLCLHEADLDLKRGGDEKQTLALFLSRSLLTTS